MTRGIRRVGVFGLVIGALLGFQAPALAGMGLPVPDPTLNYRWMDGSGAALSSEGLPVPHWFSLRCDVTDMGYPNRLVIKWKDLVGNSYRFELKTATTHCFYQTAPSLMCDQLVFDCFDTIFGTGTGSLRSWGPTGEIDLSLSNCEDCGFVEFRFTDNGPPNTGELFPTEPQDGGTFSVSDLNLSLGIVSACSECPASTADYRAHQRGTCRQS